MTTVQLKRGTASQWYDKNPVLKNGELGIEIDTKKIKVGNGTNQWRSLNYINVVPADFANTIGSYLEVSEKGTPGGLATLNSEGFIPNSQIPSEIARDTEIITSYNDLDDLPVLFSGSYNDLTDKPSVFDGSYNSLTDKPTIPSLSGYATETYVGTAISNLIDSAPNALNTLNELAAAINDDASYASTITTALGNKQDKVSGVSDTEIGYLDGVTSLIQGQIDAKSDKLTSISSKSTSYAIQSTDLGKLIEMSGGGTISVEDSISFPVGFTVDILQTSSSQVTISGIGTTVINATPGLKLRTQWSSATLIKRDLDLWVLLGDLAA